MRIGEILVEAELITPKQLSAGLDYAKAKAIPIGRCLMLLKSLEEPDLQRALRAQQILRTGLPAELAVIVLKQAVAQKIPFDKALQGHYDQQKTAPAAQSPPGTLTLELQKSHIQAMMAEKEVTDPQELLRIGDQLFFEDNIPQAEKLYLQAKKYLELKYGNDDVAIVPGLVKLGHLYLVTDRSEQAEALYTQALALRKQSFGADDLSVADSLEDLADLYQARGDIERARQMFFDACLIREKRLPDDIDRFIYNMKKAVVVTPPDLDPPRLKIGELLSEAALVNPQQLQQALQYSKTKGVPVGNALKECGFINDTLLESALTVQLLVNEHKIHSRFAPRVVRAAAIKSMDLKTFAKQYGLVPDKDEDKSPEYRNLVLEQDRLIASERGLGPEHPEVARIAAKLGKLHENRGSLIDAEMLYARVLRILAKSPEADIPLYAEVSTRLGMIHTQAGRHVEAQPILLKALELATKSGSNQTFACLIALATGEHAQQNDAVACSFLRSAAAIPVHGYLIPESELKWIVNALLDSGLNAEAEDLLLNQIKEAETECGPLEPEVAARRRFLGDLYVERKETAKAQGQYYLALQIFDRALSDPEGNAAILREKLERLNVKL